MTYSSFRSPLRKHKSGLSSQCKRCGVKWLAGDERLGTSVSNAWRVPQCAALWLSPACSSRSRLSSYLRKSCPCWTWNPAPVEYIQIHSYSSQNKWTLKNRLCQWNSSEVQGSPQPETRHPGFFQCMLPLPSPRCTEGTSGLTQGRTPVQHGLIQDYVQQCTIDL